MADTIEVEFLYCSWTGSSCYDGPSKSRLRSVLTVGRLRNEENVNCGTINARTYSESSPLGKPQSLAVGPNTSAKVRLAGQLSGSS